MRTSGTDAIVALIESWQAGWTVAGELFAPKNYLAPATAHAEHETLGIASKCEPATWAAIRSLDRAKLAVPHGFSPTPDG